MTYTDEELNAFVDNQLGGQKMESIRKALIEDPMLSERLEEIVFVDSLVQSSYASIDSKPLPQGIVNLLSERNDPLLFRQPAGLKGIFAIVSNRAFYATLALLLTIGLWSVTNNPGKNQDKLGNPVLNSGLVDTDSPLHVILENVSSSVSTTLDHPENQVLTPILTFVSNQGEYCREITLQTATTISRSIACRQNNRQWNIELSAFQRNQVTEDGYATASSGSPNEFEQYANDMIKDEPFSAEAELELIKNGWD